MGRTAWEVTPNPSPLSNSLRADDDYTRLLDHLTQAQCTVNERPLRRGPLLHGQSSIR